MRKYFNLIAGWLIGTITAGSLILATSNTEIMTEIGAALGYNASVKQLLHVADDDGLTTTRTAIYDADGTASYFYLATTSLSVNDGTDNWLLMSGLATTMAIGAAAGDDFVLEDTAGVDLITVQGDVKDILFTLDGTTASDILVNDGGGVVFTFGSDDNSVTWTLDATADADYSIGKSGTEQFLLETDVGLITATTDGGFDIVIGVDAGDDFNVSDGTLDRIHVDGDADALLTGTWVFSDGAYDFDVASHDATNGLKLGGVLLAASATEINEVADMSTHVVAPATGNLAMTAALHGNRVLYYDDADGTITLPAATATGYTYIVVLKTAATAAVIQAASASDSFVGGISGVDGDADTAIAYSADTADDTISLNGTSTGGIVGDWYMFIDVATGIFLVSGYAHHSGGSEVTCFSAAVS